MATATRGCLSKVFVDDLATDTPVEVGGIQEWSISEEAESIDASEIGTCTKSSIAGATTITGSMSGFWDIASANQDNLTIGNIISMDLYPQGNDSGSIIWETGASGATITSVETSGGVDSLVSFSVSFEVNGGLTKTNTVP